MVHMDSPVRSHPTELRYWIYSTIYPGRSPGCVKPSGKRNWILPSVSDHYPKNEFSRTLLPPYCGTIWCVAYGLRPYTPISGALRIDQCLVDTLNRYFSILAATARPTRDVPSAAILVMCARGVFAVPAALLIIMPLSPSSFSVKTRSFFVPDAYHESRENKLRLHLQALRQQ